MSSLCLFLGAGSERYAVPAAQLLEVVCAVPLKSIPRTPPFIAGMFQYRGDALLVIDLCRLLADRSCTIRLSSRIVVVRPGQTHAKSFGILAERVTELGRLDTTELKGAKLPGISHVLGSALDRGGLVHVLDVETLLPERLISMPVLEEGRGGGPDRATA